MEHGGIAYGYCCLFIVVVGLLYLCWCFVLRVALTFGVLSVDVVSFVRTWFGVLSLVWFCLDLGFTFSVFSPCCVGCLCG